MEYGKINLIIILNIILAAILFTISGVVLKSLFLVTFFCGAIINIKSKYAYESFRKTIIIVLLVGAILMIPMFINEEALNMQIKYILIYILYTFVQFLLWYIIYTTKDLNKEVNELRKKSYKRHGIGEKKLILSQEEFEIRKEFVIVGAQRRNEVAYEVAIKIKPTKQKVYFESLVDTIGESIVESTRANYDVLGKLNDDTYILILQNMDEEKFEIVLNRIIFKLKSYIADCNKYIEIEKYELGSRVNV